MDSLEPTQGPETPSLIGYTDYRQFLADFYLKRKKENPRFSHRVFSRKAGFTSPSYLLDLIRRKKNIADKSIDGICRALGLTTKERFYFENLVRFNQSKDMETKQHYYEQLLPILKKENGLRIQSCQYEYFSHWYLPVIRELIGTSHFKEDHAWIIRKLGKQLTPAEIKRGIQLLFELKLVERDPDGRLSVTSKNVETSPEVEEVCMTHFHRQMLDRAKESLSKNHGTDREVSCITAALSPEKFRQMKQEIQEFQNRLMQNLEGEDPLATTVYQFNFQLFPLTVVSGGK
ncbi:MAG: TIGR02147 family protein [Deltaproteobacteria bacterium]|nr:TIGR02147 family protein [Deltaproteobacteria bacterium]